MKTGLPKAKGGGTGLLATALVLDPSSCVRVGAEVRAARGGGCGRERPRLIEQPLLLPTFFTPRGCGVLS